MTKDKKRKAAIREAARASGRRYAAVAREMAATSAPAAFQLGALLAECASLPAVRPDWTDLDPEWAPLVFESKLVGTAIPYGSVLELAGLLAREGRDARLTVESISPERSFVVTCGQRRIELFISQANAWTLCQIPRCTEHQYHRAFTHCCEHLARCDAPTLVTMAQDWAHDRAEDHEDNPADAGGNTEADGLVRAAVAGGWYDVVTKAILQGLFGDPDVFDDLFLDPDEHLRMRHAREREAARLHTVADAEVRRRRTEDSACSGCGCRLMHWNGTTPVHLCQECAPPGQHVDPFVEQLLKDFGYVE